MTQAKQTVFDSSFKKTKISLFCDHIKGITIFLLTKTFNSHFNFGKQNPRPVFPARLQGNFSTRFVRLHYFYKTKTIHKSCFPKLKSEFYRLFQTRNNTKTICVQIIVDAVASRENDVSFWPCVLDKNSNYYREVFKNDFPKSSLVRYLKNHQPQSRSFSISILIPLLKENH